MKKTRKIKTFEADPDVDAMLEAAKKNGLTLNEVMNKSLREYGKKTIAELAMERTKQLKKLFVGSFERAGYRTSSQEDSLAACA